MRSRSAYAVYCAIFHSRTARSVFPIHPTGKATLLRHFEVFFKQVKQTLKLSGFLSYSANASAVRSGDRPAGLCSAALCRPPESMGPQLYAALCGGAGRVVGADGRLGSTAELGQHAARSSCWGQRNGHGSPDSGYPDIIAWDSTAITLREKLGSSQLTPHPIHPFSTGKSAAITLPVGCLRMKYMTPGSNVI